LAAIALRRKYSHSLFNPHKVKSESCTSNMKQDVKRIYGVKCAICDRTDNLSVAHILKSSEQCANLKIPWDNSNFITLCGYKGQDTTCHHYFDTFQVSFLHIKGYDLNRWVVAGGPHHGKLVTLATYPRKRALHAHFTKCYLDESLIDFVKSYTFDDLDISDDSEDIA
jgi:hypothetical protein